MFAREAGAGLWSAIGLLALISAFEGGGLLMLVPLLQSVGVGGATNIQGIAGAASVFLQRAGIPTALPSVLVLFIGLKVVQAGLRAWSDTWTTHLEIRFVCSLRERLYRAIMSSNWLYLSRQRASDLNLALLQDLPTMGVAMQQLLSLVSVVALGVVQIFIAWALSPATTLIALAGGLTLAVALHGPRRHAFSLRVAARDKNAEMASAISEHLAGMKVAKSHGREPYHLAHFSRTVAEVASYGRRAHRVHALTQLGSDIAIVVAMCAFVFFAVELRNIGAARLVMLAFILARLLGQISALQAVWGQLQRSLPAFAAVQEMQRKFADAAETQPPALPRRLSLRGEIRVQNLSFAYDSAAAKSNIALRRIDLVVSAGQVVAICGPSGAGKSTLADILLGLLAPTEGRILVDGNALTGDLLHDWRQSLGYVPQDTFLFHETIRANLLWANPAAATEDLRNALSAAAADQFIDRLPSGIETVVGDRGVRLSGGERQRIALARALLRKPTFLVLDEATSALDTHNERLVQDAIERLRGNMTIVLIAHRLSTVRIADKIIVLENGTIAESGTWNELCARESGVFKRLVAADTKH